MEIRAVTGYVAHVMLLAYWMWTVAATAPQLRKGTRDRLIRMRVLAIKTAGFALTALLVGIIHYWATAWWQVVVALPVAAALGVLLRRAYRRTVAVPRHRLTIARRVTAFDLRLHPRGRSYAPLHLRADHPEPGVAAQMVD